MVATLVRVYRGGTTWNDHFVAAVCFGCIAVYPVLFAGAVGVGVHGPLLALLGGLLLLGAAGIYALFHVLDGRRDPGLLIWLAYLSQPAYAFSLWAGLVGLLWMPTVALINVFWDTGLHPLWPSWLLLPPLLLAAWGTAWTYGRHGKVAVHRLPAPGLAQPLRMAHLSDLHVSPVMTRAHMARLVADTNALQPDLVLITGDLVMPFSEAEHAFLLETLAELDAPVLCCPGNHDLPVTEVLGRELADIGAAWLVDQAELVEIETSAGTARLEILGVDFHWKGAQAQLERALAALPPVEDAHYRVLLAHDPRLFLWVPEGRVDLVLSGHTHGGQVATDMFGLPWSVMRLPGFYDQGFFHKGPTRLYVHRGNWHTGLPPRMGVAAEIVLFELVPGAAAAV